MQRSHILSRGDRADDEADARLHFRQHPREPRFDPILCEVEESIALDE
jgi:hypothetical protein